MSKLHFPIYLKVRRFSGKVIAKLNEDVNALLDKHEIVHKGHPGVIKPRTIDTPSWLYKTVKNLVSESQIPLRHLELKSREMTRYLFERRLPNENEQINQKMIEVLQELNIEDECDIDEIFRKNQKAKNRLKQKLYKWESIDYTKNNGLLYMICRSAPEHAVLYRILKEINLRNKDFKPKTLFDFGSGIGTVMWAASEIWPHTLQEYVCIDVSSNMNSLSEELAQNAVPAIKTIFYRQFFPARVWPTYDIVVSAYSLLELPSKEERLEIVLKLWQKTEHYLIIVEQGTRFGFEVVNEARDFILNFISGKKTGFAHTFSPCPHNLSCPKYEANKNCTFTVQYYSLPLFGSSSIKKECFSYIVLKKDQAPQKTKDWPRIVEPVLRRPHCAICRMCTASGELKEEIFVRSKHGRHAYRCARSSRCGDQLPIHFEEITEQE